MLLEEHIFVLHHIPTGIGLVHVQPHVSFGNFHLQVLFLCMHA